MLFFFFLVGYSYLAVLWSEFHLWTLKWKKTNIGGRGTPLTVIYQLWDLKGKGRGVDVWGCSFSTYWPQWVLTYPDFTLVDIWALVLNFCRKVADNNGSRESQGRFVVVWLEQLFERPPRATLTTTVPRYQFKTLSIHPGIFQTFF